MIENHNSNKKELILSRKRSLAIKKSTLVKRGLEGIKKIKTDFEAQRIIIIADDDAAIREALGEFLGEVLPDKYQVIVAPAAEYTIENFSENKDQIAAVITNHIMPGITGAEFIEWIQENHPQIPTVLYSGALTQEEFSKLPIAAAPNCIFFKSPVKFEYIHKILMEMLEQNIVDSSWI